MTGTSDPKETLRVILVSRFIIEKDNFTYIYSSLIISQSGIIQRQLCAIQLQSGLGGGAHGRTTAFSQVSLKVSTADKVAGFICY